MKRYIIKLISHYGWGCAYGYWSGQDYIFQGERFAVDTGRKITYLTKVYVNRKLAENAAKKCFQRYVNVYKAEVEEVDVWRT